MEFWDTEILPRLLRIEVIEWFTFAVNIVVFIFSKSIASRYGAIKDEENMRSRLRILHGFNLVVFLSFILSVVINNASFPAEKISLTCLTLLVAYLLIHLAEALLLKRYGEEVTVMGFTRRVETSTSSFPGTTRLRDNSVELGGRAYQRLGTHQFPANNRRDRLPRTFDLYHQGLLDARFPQRHSLDQQ